MPDPVKHYLAFDFGTKKIGIAHGNSLTCHASPLQTLHYPSESSLWQQIDQLLQDRQVDEMIVGIPLHMDQSTQHMTTLALEFSRTLEKRYQKPVHHVDERLTSLEAKSLIRQQRQAGRKKKTRKGDIDKIAASLILQQWLQAHE